jgi:hypothetical protein
MANLSNIITQTVGNSSGGVNLITAPSQSSIWTATGLTLSTTTTAAELPLEGFSSSAVKFLLTGSTTSAYVDFLVPTALAQTKLGLQWYARANVTTIGSITLSLSSYASAGNRTSNTSPTTVTLQTSSVASAATSFNTTFDTASQQYYRLTLNFPASASNWYTLAQFVLGPGVITQGAAVSEWVSYTPSNTQGFGTTTNNNFEYRRVGSSIELIATFTTGTVTGSELQIGLPTGLTTLASGSILKMVGRFNQNSATAGTLKTGPVFIGNGLTYIQFGFDGQADAQTPFVARAGTFYPIASTASFGFFASFPIAEWAGNGTVNLGAGAQNEYTATSDTWDGTGSTTIYGPSGQAIAGNLASTSRTKTVTWQYPIQAGDIIQVEIDSAGTGRWVPIVGTYSATSILGVQALTYTTSGTGANSVGVVWRNTGANTTEVVFGRYYAASLDGSTVLGGWSDFSATSGRWRVRKSSASSPVGFGLVTADSSGLLRGYTSMAKIRLHTGNGHGSTNTVIRRFANTVVNTGTGITYADSATLGASFTCTEAGIYSFCYGDCFSTGASFGLSLNSAQLTTNVSSITTSARLVYSATPATSFPNSLTLTIALAVGDVVRPHTNGDTESGVPDRVSFTVQRIA